MKSRTAFRLAAPICAAFLLLPISVEYTVSAVVIVGLFAIAANEYARPARPLLASVPVPSARSKSPLPLAA